MPIIFATTTTPDYARPWIFPTLGFLSGRVCALLHPEDHRPLPVNCERVNYRAEGVVHQDGRFLEAIPGLHCDDIVVLADADGVLQRDWSEHEREYLANATPRDGFAMGYNLRPGQRGEEEFDLLHARCSLEETAEHLQLPAALLRGAWIYNTGLMAARVSSWLKLRDHAAPVLDKAAGLFGMHSYPQYLLCCVLHQRRFPVYELGYETHSHAHFPLTRQHRITARRLYYGKQLVFYAHNVPGVSH